MDIFIQNRRRAARMANAKTAISVKFALVRV